MTDDIDHLLHRLFDCIGRVATVANDIYQEAQEQADGVVGTQPVTIEEDVWTKLGEALQALGDVTTDIHIEDINQRINGL